MFKAVAKKGKEELKTEFSSLFQIKANDIEGKEVLLGDLAKGKKCIMVVNVASKCGLTDAHYTDLVKLHNELSDQGFDVWAFPCNQFMGQEKKSEDEICKFA